MADTSQTNLREPDQMDWDNYQAGGKYTEPPPAKDSAGNSLTYTGQIMDIQLDANDEGYRTFILNPVKLVKNGPGADGLELRYYASVRQFKGKDGQPVAASPAGNVLRAAGVVAKPQTNAQYDAVFKNQVKGRVIPFTIDWVAKNRDTGEEVVGFDNFPVDPTTGRRKAILRAGDVLPNGDVVKSEVLFANARIKYIQTKGK